MPSPSRGEGGPRKNLNDNASVDGTSIKGGGRTRVASVGALPHPKVAGRSRPATERQDGEGKAEQERRLRRPDGAERDQLALHRVAQGLRARRGAGDEEQRRRAAIEEAARPPFSPGDRRLRSAEPFDRNELTLWPPAAKPGALPSPSREAIRQWLSIRKSRTTR